MSSNILSLTVFIVTFSNYDNGSARSSGWLPPLCPSGHGSVATPTAEYPAGFFCSDSEVIGSSRSSLVIQPANGSSPPLPAKPGFNSTQLTAPGDFWSQARGLSVDAAYIGSRRLRARTPARLRRYARAPRDNMSAQRKRIPPLCNTGANSAVQKTTALLLHFEKCSVGNTALLYHRW